MTIASVLTGFRLIAGEKINEIIAQVNDLTGGGTPGPVTATTITASSTITATGAIAANGGVNGALGAGTPAAAAVTNYTGNGSITNAPQIVTAAGATQGNATAITKGVAIVTVALTASTKGVRLPTAATGLMVYVGNVATFGVKVYPATNGKIGAASTNAADSTVLAINKGNLYVAQNTTRWTVFRGA